MTNMLDSRPTGPAAPLPPPRPPYPAPRPARSPAAVRVLWKVFAGLLIVGALVWGPYQVVTLLAHDERVEEESFPAAGVTRLEVDSATGSVRIQASERDTIDVRAEISDGLRRTGESRELVDGVLRLRSRCPNYGSDFCWVDYTVLVPRDLALVIDSDDGSINVDGSAGPVAVNGDDGSIEVTAASGPLELSTDNGRVEATRLTSTTVTADSDNGSVLLDFAAAPMTVVATTENGRVEVVVPDDGTAYRTDVQTDNGSATTGVPVDSSSERAITIRTENGSATARTG